MIEKLKISLWDVLTFFVTGILIVVNIKMIAPDTLTYSLLRLDYIKSEFLMVGYLIVLVYVIGAAFEPISNLILGMLNSLYSKFKFPRIRKSQGKDENNIDDIYKSKTAEIVKNEYGLNDDNPFDFARNYILRAQETPYSFMQFLSKYGLYRNLSVLALINTIYWGIRLFKPTSLNYWALLLTGFSLH